MGTTAPSDDPGWDYVGQLNGASCVYLGNGWVISCAHVGYGNPVFNGTTYSMISGTNFTLKQTTNPAVDVDLTMFRINTQPSGLPSLTLPSLIIGKDTPAIGTSVTAIGYGLNQETTTTTWGSLTGYKYASGAPKRWGTNTVDWTGSLTITGTNWVNFDIGTTFDNGTAGEFQYAAGDSGGGMFTKDVANQVWKLIGLNEATNSQRGDAAVFGDTSYAVDLSYYRDQIVKAVQVFQLNKSLANPNVILGNPGKQDWLSVQLVGSNAGFGASTGNWYLPIDLNGYTLAVDSGANNISLNGTLSSNVGNGGLTKQGSGKLTLSAANTYSGATTVTAGTLEITSSGSLSNSPIAVSSGTLQIDVTGKTLNALNLSNNATLSLIAKSGATTTVIGALTLNGGNYTLMPSFSTLPTAGTTYNMLTYGSKSGTGNWGVTLLSNSRVTGTVSMSGGLLQFTATTGAANLVWNATSGTWDLNTTANFKNSSSTDVFKHYDAVTFDDTLGTGAGKIVTLSGYMTPSVVTVNNTTSKGDYTFSGSGYLFGASSLVKNGPGKLTISNTTANTFYGGTTVLQGTLAAGIATAFGAGAVNVNGGSAILDAGDVNVTGIGPLILSTGTIQANLGSFSATSFEVQSGSVAARLTGQGTLNKTTVGTVTLSKSNSYSGGTNLFGGTLSFSSGSLGSLGQISFLGNSTLQWNNNQDDLSGRLTIGDGANATFDTNGKSIAISQPFGLGVNQSGSLTKTGTGTLTLSATNLYTGGTNLAAGTLNFGLWSLNSSGSITFTGNSTLQWGTSYVTQDTNIAGRIVINDGVTATLDTNGFNVNLPGSFHTGPYLTGGLTKAGAGILTLSAANTFAGATNISAGTLNLGDTGALQQSTLNYTAGTLSFDSGIASHAFTLGGLSGSKNITLRDTANNAVALSIGNNNATTIYSGSIDGTGSLKKIGTGALTLTGPLTYSGNTTVSAGTLNVLSIYSPGATISVVGANSILNATSITADTLTISSQAANDVAPLLTAESISIVPEPNTWVLLLVVFSGIGIFRLCRRRIFGGCFDCR